MTRQKTVELQNFFNEWSKSIGKYERFEITENGIKVNKQLFEDLADNIASLSKLEKIKDCDLIEVIEIFSICLCREIKINIGDYECAPLSVDYITSAISRRLPLWIHSKISWELNKSELEELDDLDKPCNENPLNIEL